MFILMPESCFTPDSLTQADPRIILDGNLETTYASRAGKMNRPYVNNVYKIDAGGGEVRISVFGTLKKGFVFKYFFSIFSQWTPTTYHHMF